MERRQAPFIVETKFGFFPWWWFSKQTDGTNDKKYLGFFLTQHYIGWQCVYAHKLMAFPKDTQNSKTSPRKSQEDSPDIYIVLVLGNQISGYDNYYIVCIDWVSEKQVA